MSASAAGNGLESGDWSHWIGFIRYDAKNVLLFIALWYDVTNVTSSVPRTISINQSMTWHKSAPAF